MPVQRRVVCEVLRDMTADEAKQEVFRLRDIDVHVGDCYRCRSNGLTVTVSDVTFYYVYFKVSMLDRVETSVLRSVLTDHYDRLTVDTWIKTNYSKPTQD